jgi:hypothetical protein
MGHGAWRRKFRISNLKTRSQETGVRIQEKKNKKEFLLPPGY